MSVIRVLTDNGVKKVRIAGEQPTPEEIELMRNEFSDMGGTQTMPMPPALPQELQRNAQVVKAQADIPTISADPLSPQEREVAKQQARQRLKSIDTPGMGTVATKLVRPRFAGEQPSQGEVAAGKGFGRALGAIAGATSAILGDEETAKRIDKNLADLPYEEGIAGLTEGVTQFLALATPVTQAVKATGAGKILQTTTASGVSGGLGFSGQQARLSDLVQEFPAIANPVTDFLASDVDDSFAVGRFKSALEFAGLDYAIMLPFIKTLRQTRGQARNAKTNGEVELAQQIDKSVPKQKPNAVVKPPQKNGKLQANVGQVQLPDKVVEAVAKPVELALKGGNIAMQKSLVLSDTAIRPLKSRIEDLSKSMSQKLDEFEVNQNMLAGNYMHKAVPFLKSFNKMKNVDRQKFTRHALNSEMSEAYDVLRKYNQKLPGIKREFDELIVVFEELHELGKRNGLDIPYRKNYLPRIMKDYEGFRKAIGKDLKDPIEEAIDEAQVAKTDQLVSQAKKNNLPSPSNTALTKFEEREVIRRFLEGQKYTGDGTPGFMKNRVIDKIEKDHLKFYGSFGENVQNYINNLTYRVAKNQFTGQVKGVEGYTELLSRLRQRGDISTNDAKEINRLIGVRLDGGEQSLGAGMQMFRDGVYLSSIANPISTLTQASEFMLNAFRYGTFDTLATAKQTAKRTGLKMSDIGIDDVAREFSEPLSQSQAGNIGQAQKGINSFLRGALGKVGFKRMDELMKESNLNTALRVARKKVANKNSKEYQEFASEMAEYYGSETTNFLDALKRGDVNDGNVKTYLYSQLAKTQPIGLSEYPEIYLKYPSMRPFYFLKSFGLKQLETTRRDVLRKLASGNANEIREGMKQGLRLSLLFGGAMTTNNLFKDYLLDRDDKPGMLGDQVPTKENVLGAGADAILTLFGLSRFITRKAYNDPEGAIVDMFLPPKLMDSIESGVSALKGEFDKPKRFIEKSFPIGGKIYSEHFGSAADYKRKKRIKEYKARKRAIENIGKMPSIPNIPELELE